MAAHRSPTALQQLRKREKSQFPSTFTTLHFLSPPWTSPHFTPISSSASPSPPTLKLDLISYDSWTPLEPHSCEDLILHLLTSPSTQELAMEMYLKARGDSTFRPPNPAFFTSFLTRVVKSRRWDLLDLVLDDAVTFRMFPDSAMCAWLVGLCVRSRKFRAVESILNEAEFATPVLESAMRGYNKLHMYSSTVAAYEKSCFLDPAGYSYIMEAYMKLGKLNKVLELFSELETTGKIESLSNPTRVYEVVVESLGRSGESHKALHYYREMTVKGIPTSPSIYSSLITSLAKDLRVEDVEELVEQGRRNRMLKDPALFLKLVLMYVKLGLVDKTLEVVEIMLEANLRVSDCIFCGITNGFAKQRGLKSAVEVHERLVFWGIVPGQVSLASVLNIYFRLGMYSEAESVFEEMDKRGFDRCVVAYSTMIVMYGKIGKPREAMRLVAKMKSKGCEPNVWVYNSLIDLHGRRKDVRQVEKIWKEMKRRRVTPDRVSYTSLINAWSKAREYDKCVEAYEEFRLNGGVADRAMAGTMVGVLSKVGRVDQLIGLLQDMKAQGTKLDERLCRSALNALRDSGLRVHLTWLEESFDSMNTGARNPRTMSATKKPLRN